MVEERGVELNIPEEEEPDKDSEVFFNTEMRLNRDISVSCLQVSQNREEKELRICEPCSASGIRGLRYSMEVEGIKRILLNDISPTAVEKIEENIEKNKLEEDKFEVTNKDANVLLSENKGSMDYVDIDPFGSPVSFLDSTARSLFHEGFVGFTATDLGPLCGTYKKTCMRRYSSKPLKNSFGHETGMRILLKTIFESFSRYDYNFKPLLSYYRQHYHRVFGRAYESKKGANRALRNIGYTNYCEECGYRDLSEVKKLECPECGSKLSYAGPLWIGNLGDSDFCEEVRRDLSSRGYFEGSKLVEILEKEYEIKTPFYDTHNLASLFGVSVPKLEKIKQIIRKKGYKAESTHFSKRAFRSNAPIDQIKELI